MRTTCEWTCEWSSWWLKSVLASLPATFITLFVHVVQNRYYPDLKSSFNGSQMWAGFNMALGFLIVFRTQQAYSRWWEGGSLLQKVRGEWYNATSSLIAFTSRAKALRKETVHFQHLLVRLMSLLHCSALQQVADLPDSYFEILSLDGVEEDSMTYLRQSGNRCEVLTQWIQRMVIEGMDSGVLPVAAPVISRVFQELSRGMVTVNDVRKLKEFKFPIPYVEMIQVLLMLQWLLSPFANSLLVDNQWWAASLSFLSVFSYWSMNFIAREIEMPFGSDVNDLPIAQMQTRMNASLWILLERKAQLPPDFVFHQETHGRRDTTVAMPMRQSGAHNLQDSWVRLSNPNHNRSSTSLKSISDSTSCSDRDASGVFSEVSGGGTHSFGATDSVVSRQARARGMARASRRARISHHQSYVGDGDSCGSDDENRISNNRSYSGNGEIGCSEKRTRISYHQSYIGDAVSCGNDDKKEISSNRSYAGNGGYGRGERRRRISHHQSFVGDGDSSGSECEPTISNNRSRAGDGEVGRGDEDFGDVLLPSNFQCSDSSPTLNNTRHSNSDPHRDVDIRLVQ